MNILGLFRRQIQVARVLGIPVRIDYRWFVVFALSAWVIAVGFREGTTMTQFVRLDARALPLHLRPRAIARAPRARRRHRERRDSPAPVRRADASSARARQPARR